MKNAFLLFLALACVVVTLYGSSLESQVEIICESDLTNDTGLVGTSRDDLRYRLFRQFAPGTATDCADTVYHASLSVASGGTSDIDLAGSLTNSLGLSAVFAHVLAFTVENTGTTTLTLGAHPTAAWIAWGTNVSLPGSASVTLMAPVSEGWTVTAGSSDTLRITNATGATGTYKIWVIGKSS